MYKTITNANAKEFEGIVRNGTISLISKKQKNKKGNLKIKKKNPLNLEDIFFVKSFSFLVYR